MKKLLLTLALVAMASFADAQGTIQFANNAGTRFRINGVIPVQGTIVAGQFTIGVFVGPTADSLSCDPVLPLGSNTMTSGLISAPNPQAYPIPGYAPGSTVFMQIRGWESRFGADWLVAARSGLFAQTEIRAVTLGPASGPGTVIWSSTDLTKFQSTDQVGPGQIIPDPLDPCVPEPSTIALVGLGLASLLLLRRRK